MDDRIPKYLEDPPEACGEEKKWQELLGRYLDAGLEDISTEALSWDPESVAGFMEDLEYCIRNHVDYYDLRPEHKEKEDNFY